MEIKTNDYPYIIAWGRYLGSHKYYIDDQVKAARQAGAPVDAIQERTDRNGPTGVWATFAEVTNPHARIAVQRMVDEMRAAK